MYTLENGVGGGHIDYVRKLNRGDATEVTTSGWPYQQVVNTINPRVIRARNTPTENRVYFTAATGPSLNEQAVFALDADDAGLGVLWESVQDYQDEPTDFTIGAEGGIYVGGDFLDGLVRRLDPSDGSTDWEFSVPFADGFPAGIAVLEEAACF